MWWNKNLILEKVEFLKFMTGKWRKLQKSGGI
jgi:hypothetical protein